jgi:hypothetical protein
VTGVDDIDGVNNTISGNNTADFAGIGTDLAPPNILNIGTNGSVITVYFNETVDETTANDENNYILWGLSNASSTVSGAPAYGEQLTISVADSITGNNSVVIEAASTESLPGYFASDAAFSNQTISTSIANAINYSSDSPVRAYVNSNNVQIVSKTYGTDGDITITENLANVDKTENVADKIDIISDAGMTAVRHPLNNSQVDLTYTSLASGIYQLEVSGVEDTVNNNAIPAGAPYTTLVTIRTDEGGSAAPPYIKGAFATDSKHIKLLFDEPVDQSSAGNKSTFAIERDYATFTVTGGTNAGDTIDIDYDTGSTYTITGKNGGNDPVTNEWGKSASAATSAENITALLNDSSDSPVFAGLDVDGVTIRMVRRANTASGTETIDTITPSAAFGTFNLVSADDNLTIASSMRNEAFPWEGLLTLTDPIFADSGSDHLFKISAVNVSDNSLPFNTQFYNEIDWIVPDSDENNGITPPAPTDDTTPPEVLSAIPMSDAMLQVIFSEEVSIAGAAFTIYATDDIASTLSVSSFVLDASNPNQLIITTELMGARTYTLTVTGVTDTNSNPIAGGTTVDFTGMAAVTIDNGPVGNTINGIGNVNNYGITSMVGYDNRLYISTFNKFTGTAASEVHRSDLTGVYYTIANQPGFSDLAYYPKVKKTSLGVFGGLLFAVTYDTPSGQSELYSTDGTEDAGNPPLRNWTKETSGTWGNSSFGKLLDFGELYIIISGGLKLRTAASTFTDITGGPNWDGEAPSSMTVYGGRLYVGAGGTVMTVFRSAGANAGAPAAGTDFEQVLDSNLAGNLGMAGYDVARDGNNTVVSSMTVFNGNIYAGSANVSGAQVWRSQDGVTWEKVVDFGDGTGLTGGVSDLNNDRITSMAVNGNYLYIGTKNNVGGGGNGAEVWRTPDGVTWEQFGTDGFGSTSNTDVSFLYGSGGLIYICTENTASGGAVFRASN